MIKKRRSMKLLRVVMGCKAATFKPKKGKGAFRRQFKNKKEEKNYIRMD